MEDRQQRIKAVKAGWSDIVLVCRKCSKKLRGGFGAHGDTSLGKALAKELARPAGDGHRKRGKRRNGSLLVIGVGCQDLCPKQAVVACRPALAPRWLIIPKGMPISDVAAELGMVVPRGNATAVPVATGTGLRSDPFREGRA